MRTTAGVPRKRKNNRLFKRAKGYTGGRRRLLRSVKETLVRAEAFAYRDRRARKREFRKLWIIRINAACRERGIDLGPTLVTGTHPSGMASRVVFENLLDEYR